MVKHVVQYWRKGKIVRESNPFERISTPTKVCISNNNRGNDKVEYDYATIQTRYYD